MCMCLFIWACMQVRALIYAHIIGTRAQCSTSSIALHLTFETGSLTEPGAHKAGQVGGQPTLEIHLSLSSPQQILQTHQLLPRCC